MKSSTVPVLPAARTRGFEVRVTGRNFYLRCLVGVERGRSIEQCGSTFTIRFNDVAKADEWAPVDEHRDGHKAALKGFDDAAVAS